MSADVQEAIDLSPPGPVRILVVDDNADAALALALLLELEGYAVSQAGDGVEGFEAAQAFEPAIGIFDLDMPRRNGFDLARMVKEQPWGQPMVLMALTGHDDGATRAKAAANGFDLFFRKPIDPATFGAVIRSIHSPPSP
jgi:DNA-binding response OmpR family regulator